MTADAPLYMDHLATTPCDPRVLAGMTPWFASDFGNPASRTHRFGWKAAEAVDGVRQGLLRLFGAVGGEVVFTSGATESVNLALQGVLRAGAAKVFVTQPTEHQAVLGTAAALARDGVPVRMLEVDGRGRVDPGGLVTALADGPALVSVMAANNEIGTIQPLREVAARCRERGALLHVDAAPAAAHLELAMDAVGIDLLSLCAHKMYGPKGVGTLVLGRRARRARQAPLLFGGGQEGGVRPGTHNVPGIVGLGIASELAASLRDAENARLRALKERLFEALEGAIGGVSRNDDPEGGLPGLLHVSIEGVLASDLLLALPDLAVSSGAACSAGSARPSHVLSAIGLPPRRSLSAIRFGLGRGNREEDVERALSMLAPAVRRLRGRRLAAPRRGV
jgi:cysteine desulfurase